MLSLTTLRPFSLDGRLYRCFGHVLAAHHGSLLAVPLLACCGDFRQLIDGCPVPYDEALMVIDTDVGYQSPDLVYQCLHGDTLNKLASVDHVWYAAPALPGEPCIMASANGAKYGLVTASTQRWEALIAA
ncbi:hypothetical protein [Deefgea piscis]|uniref:hypothetical protein n=1 Tax=Deefgea piscis TaxID=2739061 RepID=UPI001C7F3898|nr:hypothetical protein [Deefgea piscis]QZA80879.1 hypothetical protein K4H25_15515 [Deefgea piscis]